MSGSGLNADCKKLIELCKEVEIDIRTNYRKNLVKRYKEWFGTANTIRNIKFLAKIFKWSNESPLTLEIEKNMIENLNDAVPEFLITFSRHNVPRDHFIKEFNINEMARKLRIIAQICSEERMFVSADDLFLISEYKMEMVNKKIKENEKITAPEPGTPFVQTMTAVTEQGKEMSCQS